MASQDFSFMIATSEEQMADIDCPTLCELDKKVARDFLMGAIAFFSSSLNQQRSMTPEQIKVMAYDMVDEFPNDSIVFVKLFFKKLRTGSFGNVYGTVDELTILNLYRKYRKDVITQYPMRKRQPKPVFEEVKELPEEEALPMPEWLAEKFGIKNRSEPKAEVVKKDVRTNLNHDEYASRMRNAKTKEEQIEIMKEYLK